jgi:hypothetical protein
MCKAIVTGESTHCDEMQDSFRQKGDCYVEAATTEGDCNSIENMNADFEINECLATVGDDPDACERMEDREKYKCLAIVTDDISYCYQQEIFERRWYCLELMSDDVDLCDKYHVAWCHEYYGVDVSSEYPKIELEDVLHGYD